MRSDNLTKLWGVLFWVPILLLTSGNLLAQPSAPSLRVVQPYYDSPLQMHIEWSTVGGALEYRVERQVDGGAWESPITTGTNTSYNDADGITSTSTYAYRVSARDKDGWGPPSNVRSNRAVKIWPVTESNSCTDAESVELLHGINQPIRAGGNHYLHEGIDIQGREGIDGECVRAALGGIVRHRGGTGPGIHVNIEVHIDGADRFIQYNHLSSIPVTVVVDESIEPDDHVGDITSTVWSTENNHTHFHYWGTYSDMAATTMNPLLLFDDNAHRDPQGNTPVVENTNDNDSEPIRYRIGPDEPDYLPDNDIIFNAVDIVVEATDHQSTDACWQVPRDIGYYVQRVAGTDVTDVIQSASSPYLLIDGSNWFGTMLNDESAALMDALRDGHADQESDLPGITPTWYAWQQWFAYIVTNASGTAGMRADLDANQCWATDARNTVTTPNGYTAGYGAATQARVNEEAKFPDGKYRVRIRLADFVNSTNASTDHAKDVFVDNFRPYVKNVEIKSGTNLVYSATWTWTSSQLELVPSDPDDGITWKASDEEDIAIEITTSEPMESLEISAIDPLGWAPSAPQSVNTDKTVWTFVIPEAQLGTSGANAGKHVISIAGEDFAGNTLEGYTEAKTTYSASEIPQRQADGSWDPAPIAGYDQIHRFELSAGERCMDFEGGPDAAAISSTIPGMFFTTTQGFDWIYGDKTTGKYNVHPYGNGAYVCNGNVFAWLGPNQGQGRIDFIGATARKISMLTSTYSGLWLRAYDENGQLLDSDYAPNNLWTHQLSGLTVSAPSIAYVLVHDAGNYWLIDDLCVEDLLGDAKGFLAEGAEPAMEILDVIAHGASITHLFNNPAFGVLYVILHWFGSEMSLTIYEPDGSLYGEWQTGYPPILVAINQAQPGNWQFDITAVDVPEDDYPYAFVVGTPAGQPPDVTPPVVVIHSPVDGKCYFNTNPIHFGFSADDPESGISELTAVLDGTTPIQDGQDTLISDLGNHSFRVVAVNGVGLADTAYATFNVNGFRWLAPITRKDSQETDTVRIIRNSTLPIKFTVFDSTEAFVADTTVRVVVEGTTAEFHYGQRDTCVRIDDEDPEEAKYIVNLHTNFRHWDYGIQIGEPYFIKTFFDDVLAHKVRLVVVDPPASKETSDQGLPTEFSLNQNYPNPFNPTTEISFSLPAASHVKLEVFNVMGQKVATLVDGRLEAGEHIVQWDGSEASSGVYFYRLQADDFVDTKKMILMK